MIFKRNKPGERGAAAVEFALILPILLLLVLGLVEFGRAFNVQISLTNAAREGARYMAIHNHEGDAKAAAIFAAPSVFNPEITEDDITISPSPCNVGKAVTVTIDYEAQFLTGYEIFPGQGTSINLTGKGVMLCGG
jgi:Flp pilus assembly protein TadG